jgi:hypothetical protein
MKYVKFGNAQVMIKERNEIATVKEIDERKEAGEIATWLLLGVEEEDTLAILVGKRIIGINHVRKQDIDALKQALDDVITRDKLEEELKK